MPSVVARPVRTVREWHEEVRALHRAGDLDGAIVRLERLVDAAPHVERLRRDLVVLYRLADRHLDADLIEVELEPGAVGAWSRLSRHARRTCDDQLFITAALGFEAAVPGDPVVAHFADIARAMRDDVGHDRASDGYVREVFDDYADRFDEHLASLGYRGPQVVAGLLHDLVADGDLPVGAVVADLGCGTGLVGDHLRHASTPGQRSWSGSLIGADLSPRMIELAAGRVVGDQLVYDDVEEADFVTFLDRRPGALDAVVAADAFIYVGDLRPVLRAAAAALRPGGWMIVTLEVADDDRTTAHGYAADLSGRYLHDTGWVAAEAESAGFDLVVVEELSIRSEGHRPVPGVVVVARRGAPAR